MQINIVKELIAPGNDILEGHHIYIFCEQWPMDHKQHPKHAVLLITSSSSFSESEGRGKGSVGMCLEGMWPPCCLRCLGWWILPAMRKVAPESVDMSSSDIGDLEALGVHTALIPHHWSSPVMMSSWLDSTVSFWQDSLRFKISSYLHPLSTSMEPIGDEGLRSHTIWIVISFSLTITGISISYRVILVKICMWSVILARYPKHQ